MYMYDRGFLEFFNLERTTGYLIPANRSLGRALASKGLAIDCLLE
nr:MAG TPA: hypothetical protein [Caudoviricetes sp.]